MAGSLNKVMLIGNLGRDPEVRSTQDGAKIVNLSIATSERWKDKQTGAPRERTEWHRVLIFNEHIAGVAEQYLRKGNPVYIEGQLQTRKWSDDKGVERYTTEVVLQRFRGELTLLGGNGNSGLNDPDSMASHQAGTTVPPKPGPGSTSSGSTSSGSTSSGSPATGSGDAPPPAGLDDDIPFNS